MHDRQRRRLEVAERAQRRRGVRRQAGGVEHRLGGHRRLDDVVGGERRPARRPG